MSIDKILFGNPAWNEAKASLDAGALRQRVVAANIANASTPGYRAQQVRFEEVLADANRAPQLEKTHPGHLTPKSRDASAARVEARPTQGAGNGINDVEVEREMIELQENALHYQAVAQLAAQKYRGLMDTIRSQG